MLALGFTAKGEGLEATGIALYSFSIVFWKECQSAWSGLGEHTQYLPVDSHRPLLLQPCSYCRLLSPESLWKRGLRLRATNALNLMGTIMSPV